MKNITIKPSKELKELSCLYDMKEDEIIDKILTIMVDISSIIDEVCSVNIKIGQVIEYDDLFTINHLCGKVFGSILGNACELLSKLEIWGVGDCPACGCQSEPTSNNDYRFDRLMPDELIYPANFKCIECGYEFMKSNEH